MLEKLEKIQKKGVHAGEEPRTMSLRIRILPLHKLPLRKKAKKKEFLFSKPRQKFYFLKNFQTLGHLKFPLRVLSLLANTVNSSEIGDIEKVTSSCE